jgi:hypothetical protein
VIAGDSDTDEDDVYDEWKNILLRESIALSSIIRVKNIKASTFFPKARLTEIGHYIKAFKDLEVIFVNTTLTVVQRRNLEMYHIILLERLIISSMRIMIELEHII